ncbi:hypothetical protein L798_01790 [Zootermopsis nevadensis]|uniref:Uncharacterized protein n=1 Tax=Zootermopsis nevadensis TaxID=136037 RepID=A0A067QKR9_ZOONE|nr:hypothetical protein L798_01790 [Zootermopsis nevadensis]
MYVIEFSAPAETNIVVKEAEKRTKYQDLVFELRQLYPGFTVKLIILIIGVLGEVKSSLLANIKLIPACQRNAEALYSVGCKRPCFLGRSNYCERMTPTHCSHPSRGSSRGYSFTWAASI